MSELTATQRMNAIDDALTKTENEAKDLRTFEELSAVTKTIFGDQESISERVSVLEDNLPLIEIVLTND